MRRRFEQDKKFWEVSLLGTNVEMKWGDIGSPGKVFLRGFGTEGEAETFVERQVIAQRERGFVEIARPDAPRDLVVERHQRFEWKSKFIEVSQEGAKVSVRGGKIVDHKDVADRDKLFVEHFDTAVAASAAFDARCAETRREGGVAVDPEPTHAVQTNVELETACIAAPDDPAPWAVYADWLIAHGDVRGEIAALHLAGKTIEARRVLGTHLVDLCGGTEGGRLRLDFRHGFAIHCDISLDHETTELLEDVTRGFLASPMARFVESLRFGLAERGEDAETDWTGTLHAVAHSPRAAQLRSLRFDFFDHDDSELSWVRFGDFSTAWSHLPALEHLQIRSGAGGQLGKIVLPNLRTFIRESGGLSREEIEAIITATWPKLEHLEIWFGAELWGAEGDVDTLAPILDGIGLPALRHLGIVNCEFIESLLPVLATSKLLPQLKSLDLSKGVMSESATRTLVENAAAFRHVRIDVSDNHLTEAQLERLRILDIVSTEQRALTLAEDPYVSVGE